MNTSSQLLLAKIAAVFGLLMGIAPHARGGPLAFSLETTPLSMESLLHANQSDLEALYRNAGTGAVPFGPTAGRAIPSPGNRHTVRKSKLIGLLWKGKEFPGDGTMVNRLAFGMHAIQADVYFGDSWLDGQPAIILDYANTSRLFGKARDEMREVAPGLYLGVTYIRKYPEPKLAMFYTVETLNAHGR
jgi:hypothetical protein